MKLRSLVLAGVAAAVLCGISAPSLAQQAPGGARADRQARRGLRQISLATFPVESLGKLIALTQEQKDKIKGVQDKLKVDIKPLQPAQGARMDPANRAKITDMNRQANLDIQNILTPEQKTTLREKMRELAPLMGAGIPPAMLLELKLTPEQKDKIKVIVQEAREKTRGMTPEERREKSREVMQEARTKVEALLTTEQKEAIKKFQQENRRNAAGRNTGRRNRQP